MGTSYCQTAGYPRYPRVRDFPGTWAFAQDKNGTLKSPSPFHVREAQIRGGSYGMGPHVLIKITHKTQDKRYHMHIAFGVMTKIYLAY